MTVVNPVKDQLAHITVDFDRQGRLILDNQGKKYEVTLESSDGQGNTNPLALQRGAAADKIKILIAGLFKAHSIYDQETSDLERMDRQGLRYTNGTLKHHDFLIWDKESQDANRNEATSELIRDIAPHLGGTYVNELVKAQTVWDKLENLVTHPHEPLNVNTAPASTSSTSSGTSSSSTSTFEPLSPHSPTTPVLDPMRRINIPHSPIIKPASEPATPVSPISPSQNPFDDADDEIVADLTIENTPSSKPFPPLSSPVASPSPSPLFSPETPKRDKVHFAPSLENRHRAMKRIKDSFYLKYKPPRKRKLIPIQHQELSTNITN